LPSFKARGAMRTLRYVSDEQRRKIGQNSPARMGSSKMADFFVTPPQSSVKLHLRRRALKSSHFRASQLDLCSDSTLLMRYFYWGSGKASSFFLTNPARFIFFGCKISLVLNYWFFWGFLLYGAGFKKYKYRSGYKHRYSKALSFCLSFEEHILSFGRVSSRACVL
jgi:hypothetical protein